MTKPPLYTGPRCESCGGDHFGDRVERPLPGAEPGVDPVAALEPNGPLGPVWDASRGPSTIGVLGRPYLTLAGLRRWLRRNA